MNQNPSNHTVIFVQTQEEDFISSIKRGLKDAEAGKLINSTDAQARVRESLRSKKLPR